MIAVKDPAPPSSIRPGIDSQLEAICMKAMAKNIADRYVSMREFAWALADYAGSHSTKGESSNSPAADAGEPSPTKPLSEDPLLAIAAIAESDGHESHGAQGRAARRSRNVPLLATAGIVATLSVGAIVLALLKPGPKGPGKAPADGAPHVAAASEAPGPRGPAGSPDEPASSDRRGPPDRMAERFEDFEIWDLNGDSELTPDEYPMHIIVRGDSNRDGRLTRKEFMAAAKRLGGESFFGPPTQDELRELPRHGPPPPPGRSGPRPRADSEQ